MIGRLVYGTSRLTGGASEREAQRLLGIVADAGVTMLDSAPPYGIGTAERSIGRFLRENDRGRSIAVIAKTGLPRPRLPVLKSGLRAIKRRIVPPRPTTDAGWQPRKPPDAYGEGSFDPAALAASFEHSLDLLGRADIVLLHEAGPAELRDGTLAAIERCAELADARPGFSWGGFLDEGKAACFPAYWIAEAGMAPDRLGSPPAPLPREGILHSIPKTAGWLAASNAAFAADYRATIEKLTGIDDATARIAAAFALAARAVSGARLTFTSTDPGRLKSLLAAFALIGREGLDRPS